MNNPIPNLRHLRAFREVARCKSISKASKQIFLSQPAITQAISKLENALKVSLFERRRAGMFTTEVGALFLQRVERALDLIEQGAREAVAASSGKDTQSKHGFDHQVTVVQLKAMIAVAESDNFSLAARTLGITQPSLHRAARDLEKLSGISLFIKGRYGIELSPAAVPFVLRTKLAFSELYQGFNEIDLWLGHDSSELVIGSMPLARSYVLPTAINEHTRHHPEARIRVVDGPYNDLLDSLRHGDFDMLVGALRSPAPAGDIVQEPLFHESLVVAIRPDHPLAKQADVSIADFGKYPWIIPRVGTPMRQIFDDLFIENGVKPPTNAIETSSLLLARSLLLESDRMALISTHQLMLEEKMGLLAFLPFETEKTTRPIGLTTRRDWRPTSTQEAFLSRLRAAGKHADSL